jgi:hypothetical protein
MTAASRHVLVLALDGIRGDCIQSHHKEVLGRFSRDVCEWDARTSRITVSDPAWTSAITGVWPCDHGVEEDFNKWNRDSFPSMFQLLHQRNLGSILWTQWLPFAQKGLLSDPVEKRCFPGDEPIAEDVCAYLNATPSNELASCLFVHLDDVDHAGHEFDFLPSSREYAAAIDDTCERVERIRQALLSRNLDQESWLVIVTTDHGGGCAWPRDHGDDAPDVRRIFLLAQQFTGQSENEAYIPKHAVSQLTDVFHMTMDYVLQWEWKCASAADEADYSHVGWWAESLPK